MGRSRKSRIRWWIGALFVAVAVGAGAFAAVITLDVAPRILAGYLAKRASGHSGYIVKPVDWVAELLLREDWSVKSASIPEYPKWTGASRNRGLPTTPTIQVSGSEALRTAIHDAHPGDRIEILPGEYHFSGSAIEVVHGGTVDLPITVTAKNLGDVGLKFDLVEGFRVAAPYWQFENLVIEGVCKNDADCEHAFHIVGGATGIVIRNNELLDFNAQIKINGENGIYPDHGVIESTTMVNTHPRHTDTPVTPIDLVAASDWVIHHNLIADFIKAEGNTTSYGAFAKGGGSGTRFENNVVLCDYRLRGASGKRVGLSLGGGGSEPSACRNNKCAIEQEAGVIRNNVIAFCSDDGIYLNRASHSQVVHNTILDTAGITANFQETDVRLAGNLVDGTTRTVNMATVHDDGNRTAPRFAPYLGWHPVRTLFRDVPTLDLRWSASAPVGAPASETRPDFCGQTLAVTPTFGAFEDIGACTLR